MKAINFAIFASGNGSNAQIIRDVIVEHNDSLKLQFVFTDIPNAGIVDRAKTWDTKILILDKNKYSKSETESFLLENINKFEIDWLMLAGYMKILGKDFLGQVFTAHGNSCQVVNIHPSLLPLHKGLRAMENSFASNEERQGPSLHYVDSGVDTGKLITQESFLRNSNMSFEEFKENTQKLEHKIYKEFVLKIANAQVKTNKFRRIENEEL